MEATTLHQLFKEEHTFLTKKELLFFPQMSWFQLG